MSSAIGVLENRRESRHFLRCKDVRGDVGEVEFPGTRDERRRCDRDERRICLGTALLVTDGSDDDDDEEVRREVEGSEDGCDSEDDPV